MKRAIINTTIFLKQVIFWIRPHIFLGWLRHPFLTLSNTLSLTEWMSQQKKKGAYNDFYSPRRNYAKRFELYQFVCDKLSLQNEAVDYLEFGVSGGVSFRWWAGKCTHANSRFFGFDTFEGLPENWGAYRAGDMSANVPVMDDTRVQFVKGLFQDTLPGFLRNTDLDNDKRKIIHLDADLFSSTLYALTSLAPYLKKGDILMFDEFNVPNHEYYAFKIFSESFYIKTSLVGAVNNYYQVTLIID